MPVLGTMYVVVVVEAVIGVVLCCGVVDMLLQCFTPMTVLFQWTYQNLRGQKAGTDTNTHTHTHTHIHTHTNNAQEARMLCNTGRHCKGII